MAKWMDKLTPVVVNMTYTSKIFQCCDRDLCFLVEFEGPPSTRGFLLDVWV